MTLRRSIITLAVVLVLVQGCAYAGVLPLDARRWFTCLGGPKFVLALIALFLLGVAWHEPQRSFGPGFMLFLIGVAGLIVLIESSGRVYWRFLGSQAWTQTVDETGRLKQSTVWTCGPTAAVMLLHHYGIASSEGELAYLCGTSFFGTDEFALARALNQRAGANGWAAVVRKTDYDHCLAEGQPFIASVRVGGMFAHAVYVERVGQNSVTIVDPDDGKRKDVPRQDFEAKWNGEAVSFAHFSRSQAEPGNER